MADSPNQSTGSPADASPPGARDVAFAVLDQHNRTDRFVSVLFDELPNTGRLSPADRRLALEIVSGVVRRRATLDAILAPHVRRPRHRVEDSLWVLLQMGAYQLVFLSAVPPHAAVDETVKLAERIARPRWTGFLNGVLRAVSRSLTDETPTDPAADVIPLTGDRYRRHGQPVFADPSEHPTDYVAAAFSFPSWMVTRWKTRFDFAEQLRLGFWFNTPIRPTLRVNRLKQSRDNLLDDLRAAGVAAVPGHRSESILLTGPAEIERLPGFAEGRFTVQDESAMAAAELLAPQPGQRVLDLCAAPGTKTTHLAELMADRGMIVAADIRTDRLKRIEENAKRLGIGIIEPCLIRSDGRDIPRGPFDAILLDVPCSNTGVLGKRPEARWRLRPQDLRELSEIGRRLLTRACDRLGDRGRIVYSTCSIEPEENLGVVNAVLSKRDDMRLAGSTDHVPGQPADGGYQALLVKTPV